MIVAEDILGIIIAIKKSDEKSEFFVSMAFLLILENMIVILWEEVDNFTIVMMQ